MAHDPTHGSRAGLEASLEAALVRELPARLALFEQAAAERLGIGLSDFKCLQIAAGASEDAPLTAGRLAELTGLSSGAITGVLDRLAVAGFVVRQKDPSDRRQVRIRFVDERGAALDALLAPFHEAFAALCAGRDEPSLEGLLAFAQDAGRIVEDETARLRGAAPRPAAEARAFDVVLPLEGARHGQLELRRTHGARIVGASGDFLCRGRFEGRVPSFRRRGGSLRVDDVVGSGGLLAFLKPRVPAEIELGDAVPWTLRWLAGVSELEADLRALTLLGLSVKGGAHRVTFALPEPSETVPIVVTGGAHALTMTRPATVPLRVTLHGGASRVRVDDLRLGAVGSELRWESPSFAQTSGRYDVEIRGGVSELSIAPA
jgi:DNA-binding MarR family transcriptional regulator